MPELPSTTAFLADPTVLERESLDAVNCNLCSFYRSLMVSRGIHRSKAQRGQEAMRALEENLSQIAQRKASVRAGHTKGSRS